MRLIRKNNINTVIRTQPLRFLWIISLICPFEFQKTLRFLNPERLYYIIMIDLNQINSFLEIINYLYTYIIYIFIKKNIDAFGTKTKHFKRVFIGFNATIRLLDFHEFFRTSKTKFFFFFLLSDFSTNYKCFFHE